MARPKIQKIWKRDENDQLVLDLPKIINTDIGFQLMFGWPLDYDTDKQRNQKHNNSYGAKSYNVKEYENDYIND